MSRFLLTYGPKPRIWCQTCRASTTPLVTHIDGTLRAHDIRQVRRQHVCGPGPWDSAPEPDPIEGPGAAVSRRVSVDLASLPLRDRWGRR